LPLIKAAGALTNSFSDNSQASIAKATDKVLQGTTTDDDVDVVRVDTNLVSLNVSVYGTKLRTEVAKLEQKDFTVAEDRKPQEISFFATTDVPFDLVLLLDLSGSTADKRDLIRKSTRRFIEAARPTDRIAILAFADQVWVVCPLTVDRTRLLAGADQIEGGLGSDHIYDYGDDDQTLWGGEGRDWVEGSGRILGGPGDDCVTGGLGNVGLASGDDGNDLVSSYYGTAFGGTGDDTCFGPTRMDCEHVVSGPIDCAAWF
jgi:hypothetical protein